MSNKITLDKNTNQRILFNLGELALVPATNNEADVEFPTIVKGYAAVFNVLNDPEMININGYAIRILPGAFSQALTKDILCLHNHDSSEPLGRTSNGTLKLYEDNIGLAFELALPDCRKDLYELIGNQTIKGCSIGFWVPTSEQEILEEDGLVIQQWSSCDLFEVTICSMPMFNLTSVQVVQDKPVEPTVNESNYNLSLELEYLDLVRLSIL